uniref:KIF-binding protein n=1 Tax=Graphocephala atropunctata TaxID=36148 RepID=A0A1B6MDG1_9HEMI
MTEVSEDILIELREKCEKVQNLLEGESKRDPETEPYKSVYAAREILSDMKSCLANLKDSIRSSDPLHDQIEAMYGGVLLLLGTLALDTEELATGEEHLMNCLSCLEDQAMQPKKVLVVLKALNQLGLLWSQRSDGNKSHGYLQQAEQLYNDYTDQVGEQPVDVYALFTVPDSGPATTKADSPLEKVHTLTLYYLAQVYGAMDNPLKSAIYCHNTLKRQLESKDYDKVEWALNSATLAQFFMEQNAFRQARHHLSAASYVLDKHDQDLQGIESSEDERLFRKEHLKHRSADVARCWTKYGLMLLSASRDRLMEAEEGQSGDATPRRLRPPGELSGLQFSLLELSMYEDQVTDSFVLTFDDARSVFLNSQQWLTQAKLYYTLDDHASDHVQIIKDYSELYRNLAFFEDDEERQCKMHKRRVDLLEGVVKELNPTYFLTACQELWFELGETYTHMVDIKLAKLEANSDAPSAHALQKVNHLAEQAIAAYNSFLDTLRDHKTKEIPDKFSKELERPGLLIYFYLAGLYRRLVAADKATKLTNLTNSLQYYQKVVDYCQRHEGAKDSVTAELSACQDIVALLPLKMAKLAETVAR